MPRAHRHYVPGRIWHLTHRCHDRQFLLRAEQDRRTYTRWMREAEKRFGLCVLDYCITCNHTHLLVKDSGVEECIARSLQLIAGSTAQAYNVRRNRSGAFWGDRYHATAVESGRHLRRCLGYIALNMVRAGVVADPAQWGFCGYADILNQRTRNLIVDRASLSDILQVSSLEELQTTLRGIVDASRLEGGLSRQALWTESVAVGDQEFIDGIKESLGARARYREVAGEFGGSCILREEPVQGGSGLDNGPLDNTRAWAVFTDLPSADLPVDSPNDA